MNYLVEICRSFKAVQGLESPVRSSKGLSRVAHFDVALRVGIEFSEKQLDDKGRFVDTDAVESYVEKICVKLANDRWTNLFSFRPTFELVAEWAYEELKNDVAQISYVELENETLKVKTKYFYSD